MEATFPRGKGGTAEDRTKYCDRPPGDTIGKEESWRFKMHFTLRESYANGKQSNESNMH